MKLPLIGYGDDLDYTIGTSQIRALFSRPDPPDEVLFIYRMDAIAQEEDETLTLELRPSPSITLPAGRNVFFKSTIRLTIIDSDGKRLVSYYYQTFILNHTSFETEVEIFFTGDVFQTNERNMTNSDEPAFMPVLVTKTSRIANPIVLDVSPLTVDMARVVLSSSDLPENISVVNPFSPPFAGS